MKKKKTQRLIGSGFNIENEISCDIICEETGTVKTVTIMNNERSRNILESIIKNDNRFIIPRDICISVEKF